MVIVNQNRDEIINFEKMNNIYVSKSGEVRACANMEDCVYVLGKYESEERAKEVLQEIISKYKTTLYNSKTNETVVNIPKVYEMPKE